MEEQPEEVDEAEAYAGQFEDEDLAEPGSPKEGAPRRSREYIKSRSNSEGGLQGPRSPLMQPDPA